MDSYGVPASAPITLPEYPQYVNQYYESPDYPEVVTDTPNVYYDYVAPVVEPEPELNE